MIRRVASILLLVPAAMYAESYRMGDFPMFAAAYDGDVARLGQLLDSGEAIDQEKGGFTPLTYAMDFGKLDAVRFLLERGADPGKVGSDLASPLQHAIRHGQHPPAVRLELVKLLLAKGANPNGSVAPQALTPLTFAFWANDPAVYEALTAAGGRLLMEGYDAPMVAAARAGNVEAVDRLLSLGVAPDAMQYGGRTALLEAVREGHAAVVKRLLLAKAAWPLEAAPEGGSSTTWADHLAGAKPAVLAAFLDAGLDAKARGRRQAPLAQLAAASGDPTTLELLIQRGGMVDDGDEDLTTPLMAAAERPSLPALEILLAAKADTARRDRYGRTAKVRAAAAGHADVVARLLASGATEYAGARLPEAARDALPDQEDVTGEAYAQLPGLPPRLRFFRTQPARPVDQGDQRARSSVVGPGTGPAPRRPLVIVPGPSQRAQSQALPPGPSDVRLFAVLPPATVMRLSKAADLRELSLTRPATDEELARAFAALAP